MKTPFISVVIANFNGEKYLDTCLKSVLKSVYKDFEVLVVDDGSDDNSLNIITKYQKIDSRISLLLNKTNIGAAASRNVALKKVKGDAIIFLDNDTEVTRNWIAELIKPLLREKNIGATQALLLDFERRDSIQMAGGLLIPHTGWLALFYHGESYKKIKNMIKEKEVVGISAALAVKKEVINKIGGFDEKEARYTEDLDFCWRIWIAGYKIVLANKSIVYHHIKSVSERAGMKATYRKIYFGLAKNSFRSIIKNYQVKNVFLYLPASIAINIFRGFWVLIRDKNPSALVGTFDALMWNFSNLADTIVCRFEVQKTRKVPDSFLFSRVFERRNLLEIYKRYFKG